MLFQVVVLLSVGGCLSQTTSTPWVAPDLETKLNRSPQFSMALDLLRTAGLLDTLKALPQLTLFLPTNPGLNEFDPDELRELRQDMQQLTEVLKYHATADESWHTARKDNDRVFTSLNNNLPIRVNVYNTLHTIAVEGVNITDANNKIANGWIHGIEEFIWPPAGDIIDIINADDDLSMTGQLLAQTGLDAVIRADKNITVFAPNNDAWEEMAPGVVTFLRNNPALLKETLLDHVVARSTLYSIGWRHTITYSTEDNHHDKLMVIEENEGDEDDIYINHALVIDRDLSATNGVVHIIDDILIPPSILITLEDQGFDHLVG